jgi:hypothetical protein
LSLGPKREQTKKEITARDSANKVRIAWSQEKILPPTVKARRACSIPTKERAKYKSRVQFFNPFNDVVTPCAQVFKPIP